MYERRSIAAIISGLMLVGCAAVDIGVGVQPLTTPTSAAPLQPLITPTDLPVQTEAAAALAPEDWADDSNVHVLTAAEALLAFIPGAATVDALTQWSSGEEYFVMRADGSRGLRLRAPWRALWMSGANGYGLIALDVQMRAAADPDGSFQPVQDPAYSEVWGDWPHFDQAYLDTTIWFDAPSEYDLRVVVSVRAEDYTADGAQVNAEAVYETRVRALLAPESVPSDTESLSPDFGTSESSEYAFLDWRGWRFGPCYVQTDAYPDASRALDAACSAFDSGAWAEAAEALQEALRVTEDDLPLQNRLRQQIGTIAAASGQWNSAVRQFREGLEAAQAMHDALEVSIALNNLGVALNQAGFAEEAIPLLWNAVSIRDQMGDYPASLIPWITLSGLDEEGDSWEWVLNAVAEAGLPQIDAARAWSEAE